MNDQELNRLIQELLDGTISPQDLPLLETELASNESARELYLDTVEIHSLLDAQVSVH